MVNDTGWVKHAVEFYATECLGLSEWEINVGIVYAIKEDSTILGICSQYPKANFAKVTFRGDIEDTENWHNTIIHELLHVKHSRIDNYLENVVFDALPDKVERVVSKTYISTVYEPFIHDLAYSLSVIFYPLWCIHRDDNSTEDSVEDTESADHATAK